MRRDQQSTDPLRWLQAMAIQTGDPEFGAAAAELRAAREALREIEDRAGYDRGAEWCRDRARDARNAQ